MAQQQSNITLQAPGYQGINTEDSPLNQPPEFCSVASNAVVDRFGRVGSRKAFAELTTANNVTYSAAVGAVRTEEIVNRLGQGVVNGTRTVLCSLSVFQYDSNDSLLQEDYFICELNEPSAEVYELDEITLPALTDDSKLQDCQFISFNDAIYIFSAGNECMKYDGTSLSLLFTGVADTDYIAPQDDTGVIASAIDGDIATAAYGRLWVSGVNGDYETIYWSDLLIAEQWYDGRATPADTQNTAGFIDVAQYWPSGTDRIVSIKAHNNFLYVFGRQSILIYTGLAGDPADVTGITLQDTVPGIGCVSRDAVVNIGSDVLFCDDTGVRSMGRTIQEKSVPIGDLTLNVRKELNRMIATTPDKTSISMSYWPDESITVLTFTDSNLAYVMDMSAPSQTGGLKITKWTNCVHNRALYFEDDDTVLILLAANQDSKGLLQYDGYIQYDNEPYLFQYASNQFTFDQPTNAKFVKQIDYTVVATQINAPAFGSWGYDGTLDYSRALTITAQTPALFGVAQFTDPTDGVADEAVAAEYGPGLATTGRYKVNGKGRGENVSIGFRCEINGNSCSLQEINIQTLLGRIL